MTSEYPPSGKFARVASGEMMLPAQCASCGSIENSYGFVDTKLDYEFYGVVYFCHVCAFEMTQVFPDNPYKSLQEKHQELLHACRVYESQIAKLERIIDGLASNWLSDRGFSDVSGVPGVDDLEVSQSEQRDSSQDAGQSGSNDSVVTESVTVAGRGNTTNVKRGDSGLPQLT